MDHSFAITSLPPERAEATRLLEIWRGHWGMEDRLHWMRDVVFGEDLIQVRTGSAPQLMAAFRHYTWKPWETLNLIGLPRNN